MSKRFYKPDVRSTSYLLSNHQNISTNSSKKIKSKSYLAKLRAKQEQLLKENALVANMINIGEELTEKPSVYSETSCFRSEVSFEQKPSVLNNEDEEILNTIRNQQPKAEMRSSPKQFSAKFPSPPKNRVSAEKCEELEKELKLQKSKYRKLEIQYNELLNKSTHIEMFYKDIIGNLQSELESLDSGKEIDPNFVLVGEEIAEIANILKNLEEKSMLVEGKIRIK